MAPSASMHLRRRPATRLRPVVLATLLALAPAALAWQAPGTPPPIEERMSAAEFRAAGLDQLSDAQLARLNAWLGDELARASAATAAARVDSPAPSQPDEDHAVQRSREPVSGHLDGTFEGFAKGRRYTLDNGQVWAQVDDANLAGVTLDRPRVEIRPALIGSAWYLQVDGYNTRAKVRRVE